MSGCWLCQMFYLHLLNWSKDFFLIQLMLLITFFLFYVLEFSHRAVLYSKSLSCSYSAQTCLRFLNAGSHLHQTSIIEWAQLDLRQLAMVSAAQWSWVMSQPLPRPSAVGLWTGRNSSSSACIILHAVSAVFAITLSSSTVLSDFSGSLFLVCFWKLFLSLLVS